MNQFEEELQKKIERGEVAPGEDLDVKAYQEIFRVLKKEPGYQLSPRFAENVVSRIDERHNRSLSKDYFWFFTGLFFFLLTSIITLVFTNFRLDFGFLNVMSEYKSLAIFGAAFIVFINWLDKRVVKRRLLHNSY
jgi:hypothetical protein